jgi:hypothetical protein
VGGGGDQQAKALREANALFGSTAASGKADKERFAGIQGTARIEALDAWWRAALEGDEFIYCEALSPIRDETWHRAGELARSGYLRTHSRKRGGGGHSYFAVRTAKRLTPTVNPIDAALADAATETIFRALKRAANFDRPCPTDTELAAIAGLASRAQAQHRIRKLLDLGLVKSEVHYDSGVPSRVVTIAEGKWAGVSAGKRTALPKKWAALQAAAARDAAAGGGQ